MLKCYISVNTVKAFLFFISETQYINSIMIINFKILSHLSPLNGSYLLLILFRTHITTETDLSDIYLKCDSRVFRL